MSNTFDILRGRINRELDSIDELIEQKDKLLGSAKENLRQKDASIERLAYEIKELQNRLKQYTSLTPVAENIVKDISTEGSLSVADADLTPKMQASDIAAPSGSDMAANRPLAPVSPPKYRPINIALIIGHDVLVKGAFSKFLDQHEYDYWLREAQNVEDFKLEAYANEQGLTLYTEVFTRDRTGIKSAHKKIVNSNIKFDLILELHFNAFEDERAAGAEILCSSETFESTEIPGHLLREWCQDRDLRNRGIKFPTQYSRGHTNVNSLRTLHKVNTPYLLLEPFFGSSASDVNKVFHGNPVAFFLGAALDWFAENE